MSCNDSVTSIRDDPAVQALDAPNRRHVISMHDPRQRELWEYRDGTNSDPHGYEA